MKIACAYIRVSTESQDEYSPDAQLRLITEYAAKNDILLPKDYIFSDIGISGKKAEKRPNFQKMIALTKSQEHPVDLILVWKFSRFARNQEESIVYKSLLKKIGVDVISVSEPIIDGPFGGLIERVIEWMDEYYSIRLSGEVKRGMEERASKGKFNSYAPFGYLMQNGELCPDPERADIVRRIYHDFLDGIPMRNLAIKLSNEGYTSKFNNKLEMRSIERILRNPVYIGKIVYSTDGKRRNFEIRTTDIVRNGSHEPLIDEKTFYAVQEKLLEQKNKYPKYAKTSVSSEYMLRGLIRCADCGGMMVRSHSGPSNAEAMQCNNYVKGKCTRSHYITMERLISLFLSKIQYDIVTGNFQFETTSGKNEPDSISVQRQLDRNIAKLKRIMAAYEDGAYSLEDFKNAKHKIEEENKALQKKMQSQNTTTDMQSKKNLLIKKIKKELAALPYMDPAKQNETLRSFIKTAFFKKSESGDSIDICYYF